jgi:hypothetical protein
VGRISSAKLAKYSIANDALDDLPCVAVGAVIKRHHRAKHMLSAQSMVGKSVSANLVLRNLDRDNWVNQEKSP